MKEIVAHKADLWAYDEICLAFRLSDDEDGSFEIGEQHDGFEEARNAADDRFSPFPDLDGDGLPDLAVSRLDLSEWDLSVIGSGLDVFHRARDCRWELATTSTITEPSRTV